jgi:hypothetical protein
VAEVAEEAEVEAEEAEVEAEEAEVEAEEADRNPDKASCVCVLKRLVSKER